MDYFYTATSHRFCGALWSIFAPARIIINAIIPAPEKDPLWKDPCETCGEWIRLKDKDEHMKAHQKELKRLPQPTDEELERMHDAWDFERVESERKQYQNAH